MQGNLGEVRRSAVRHGLLIRGERSAVGTARLEGTAPLKRAGQGRCVWRGGQGFRTIWALTLVGGMLTAKSKAATESLNANVSVIRGLTSILPDPIRARARG